ncbi:MAG: response regulator [Verrucomicrobiota bacterium]
MSATIQIIDDNVALTTLLAKTLAKFGYEPVVENNPLLAINSARHHLPDLILLDVMMPERDGGRVLADLRADLSLRFIPVVLLTAIAKEVQGLAETGGIRSIILSKPVQLKELLNTIESQLAGSRSFNEQQEFEAAQQQVLEEPAAPEMELPDFDRLSGPEPPPPSGPARNQSDSFSTDSAPPVDFSFPERSDGPNGGGAF